MKLNDKIKIAVIVAVVVAIAVGVYFFYFNTSIPLGKAIYQCNGNTIEKVYSNGYVSTLWSCTNNYTCQINNGLANCLRP